MKPNNEHTSQEVRFFYPVNNPIEHHESLDTSNLPKTENLPGQNHYVAIEYENGETTAVRLSRESFIIPVHAMVIGIEGFNDDTDNRGFATFVSNFDQFDKECRHYPEDSSNTSIIVQAVLSQFGGGIPDDRFNESGVAVLPYGAELPSFANSGIDDEDVKYRLLGIISPDDRLVTWHDEKSLLTKIVDWCVANQMRQNPIEEALLFNALPDHIVGKLDSSVTAKAYLDYYDNKHDTSFVPVDDPRFPYSEGRFKRLSPAEYLRYKELADLALFYGETER